MDPSRLEIAVAVPLRGREVLLRPREERGQREETGLTGGRWEALCVQAYDYADRRVRLHAFVVRDPGGEASGHPAWTWVSGSRLAELRLPQANEAIVRALIGWLA